MPKPDEAHRLTEKELAALEKRIAKVYREARDELSDAIKISLSGSVSETRK